MVNIVMGTYNGEKYIKEQLDSILHGTYKDIRIYVQDDGSTDKTFDILKEYEERYGEKVRAVKNENNMRSARNFYSALLNCGKADYYMFCDQDDVWDDDKVEYSVRYLIDMEKRFGEKTPLAAFSDSRLVDSQLNELAPSFMKSMHFDTKMTDLAHLLMENKAPGCTMCFNNALVDELRECGSRMPEHMRMHDWWIMLIAAAFGKAEFMGRPTMSYRQHENNVVGGSDYSSYVKSRAGKSDAIKKTVNENFDQGIEFLAVFESRLRIKGCKESLEILKAFARMKNAGSTERRKLAIKYGFLKSGLIRNAGLLILGC